MAPVPHHESLTRAHILHAPSSADNGPAIQAALLAAGAAAGPRNPIAVTVPAGTWELQTPVFINSSLVVLRGAGVSTLLKGLRVCDAGAGHGRQPLPTTCQPSGHGQCLTLRWPQRLPDASIALKAPLRPAPSCPFCQPGRSVIHLPSSLEDVLGLGGWELSGAFLGCVQILRRVWQASQAQSFTFPSSAPPPTPAASRA